VTDNRQHATWPLWEPNKTSEEFGDPRRPPRWTATDQDDRYHPELEHGQSLPRECCYIEQHDSHDGRPTLPASLAGLTLLTDTELSASLPSPLAEQAQARPVPLLADGYWLAIAASTCRSQHLPHTLLRLEVLAGRDKQRLYSSRSSPLHMHSVI
jgi:hypothetical protein